MSNSQDESDMDDLKQLDPLIEDLFELKDQFSEKLREALKTIGREENSEFKLKNYKFLLLNLPKELSKVRVILGNHIARNFHRMEFQYQIDLLNEIISQIDVFSNKQLAILYDKLRKTSSNLKYKSEGSNIAHQINELRKVERIIYMEMNCKYRQGENTVENIKEKYFEDIGKFIHQLVNKDQFIRDLKVIERNLEKFSTEQLVEYFGFIKNSILKFVIKQFTDSDIIQTVDLIESISKKFKIRNKSDLLKFIGTKGDPFYELRVQERRLSELKTCVICKKNPIKKEFRPLCETCHDGKIKDFPDKYFPKERVFKDFTELFDKFYQNRDENLGYFLVEIELPFHSPFTVMDLEATGDITKDRGQHITTMGFLYGNKARIYQLIDPSKHKKFFRTCKDIAYKFKKPVVAYNYEGSERIWLKIYIGGWIDIQKYDIRYSDESGKYRHSLRLEDVSFEWNDITGKECVDEWANFRESGDVKHLKIMAYHNFIDILREYLVGLTDLKVYDYLEGKIWNPILHNLVPSHSCPICFHEFYTKKSLNDHVLSHQKKKARKRKNRKKTRTRNRTNQ